MSQLLTKAFWVDAAERATKTAAQSALVAIGQDAVGFDVFAADWGNVVGLGLGAAALSVLTSLASLKRTGTASAV